MHYTTGIISYSSSRTKKKSNKRVISYSATTIKYNNVVGFFTDMDEGIVDDMEINGITESFQVKRQVIMSGSEAAEMILRVDDIVKAAPRQRERDDRCH